MVNDGLNILLSFVRLRIVGFEEKKAKRDS
jgi:hypothetical protein